MVGQRSPPRAAPPPSHCAHQPPPIPHRFTLPKRGTPPSSRAARAQAPGCACGVGKARRRRRILERRTGCPGSPALPQSLPPFFFFLLVQKSQNWDRGSGLDVTSGWACAYADTPRLPALRKDSSWLRGSRDFVGGIPWVLACWEILFLIWSIIRLSAGGGPRRRRRGRLR